MAIYINGKLVEPDENREENPTTVVDRIEAGETREFNGPVEVLYSVGQGASIKVKHGGILIKGDVCDGVKIVVENEHLSANIKTNNASVSSGSYSSVSISSSGSIFVDISFCSPNGPNGVTVLGKVGNNVKIKSNTQVTMPGSGENLEATSMNSFTSLGDIGDNSHLDAGNSLTINGSIGIKSTIKSGNSITVGNVGADSFLESGNSINAGALSERVTAQAGTSLTAAHIGERAQISAGNKVTANGAHISAKIAAGNKAKIASYVG